MTTTGLTSELDAINILLSSIGESPINTLSGSQSVDVAKAKATLNEVSLEVQMPGCTFNTEEDFELQPDAFSGEIPLPLNCLKVDTAGSHTNIPAVQRGFRLYDTKNKTFIWNRSLKVNMIIALSFEELPQHARHYITMMAARKFQTRSVGDQVLYQFTAQDELKAKIAFLDTEEENADRTIFDNQRSADILRR